MERYQVILAYDGTRFRGFQKQPNARTVQDVFEEALQVLGWRGKAILAAGRTDTGVHAIGQVIAFDLEWAHQSSDLVRALNANLPPDMAARKAKVVPDAFHPRYSAIARRYHYHLICDEFRDPLRERYAWRVWPEVSLPLMQEAAKYLQGAHDFSAFGAPPKSGGSTVREISRASWQAEGTEFIFEIVGNAFLYHMVRRLVFFLVKFGQGKLPPADMSGYLNGGEQPEVQGLAPPQGLFLAEVLYAPSELEN